MIIFSTVMFFLIFISIEYNYFLYDFKKRNKYRGGYNIDTFWRDDKKMIIWLFILSLIISIIIQLFYDYTK